MFSKYATITTVVEAKIYEVLTKKRFNRNEPYLKDKLKERIHYFVFHNAPIKLVGFWGVGLKNELNWADFETCAFLAKLNMELKKVYSPGIEFTFIFATMHGLHNGITQKSINSYTKKMEKLFKNLGFKSIYLDTLWKKYVISFDKIETIFKQKPKDWWKDVPFAKELEKLAKQRNRRLPAKEAAQKYVIMRTLEKELLEKEFKDFILHTYSSQVFYSLFPRMPRLHFYSYKKGRSESPWFITQERGT